MARLLARVDLLRPFLYAVPLCGGFHAAYVLGLFLLAGPLKRQVFIGQAGKDPLFHIGIKRLPADAHPELPIYFRVVFNFMQGGGGAVIVIHDQLLQLFGIIPMVSDLQSRPLGFQVGLVPLL